jgi:hypothetical protein
MHPPRHPFPGQATHKRHQRTTVLLRRPAGWYSGPSISGVLCSLIPHTKTYLRNTPNSLFPSLNIARHETCPEHVSNSKSPGWQPYFCILPLSDFFSLFLCCAYVTSTQFTQTMLFDFVLVSQPRPPTLQLTTHVIRTLSEPEHQTPFPEQNHHLAHQHLPAQAWRTQSTFRFIRPTSFAYPKALLPSILTKFLPPNRTGTSTNAPGA